MTVVNLPAHAIRLAAAIVDLAQDVIEEWITQE
jgi:hypothetical protein